MGQFRFVVRSGPVVGKVYPIDTPEIYIGRESSNTIMINDPQVSRRHAKVELQGSTCLIQDLGSTNGTFVNGKRISGVQALSPGDVISLGEGIVLAYESTAEANATILSTPPPQATLIQPAPVPVYQPASPPVPVPVAKPAAVPMPASIPAPAPAYSGQVPSGPVPMPAESAPTRKKFPVWIIILILLLIIICVCVGFFLVIDQLRLWCRVVPFLVPLLGGQC